MNVHPEVETVVLVAFVLVGIDAITDLVSTGLIASSVALRLR